MGKNAKQKHIVERLARTQSISQEVAQLLVEAGYETLGKIKAADPSKLSQIKGIRAATVNKLRR